MNVNKFLNLLFEPSEATCFSPDTFGTQLSFIDQLQPTDVFFSINPLIGSRKDANVTCFRNILLEIDDMPLEQQLAYVDSTLGRENISAITFSGKKSYHFIISLKEPCQTREDYDTLVRRLYKLMPKIDPACKNPSRFSRLPDAVRPDTNTRQQLVYCGSRIPRAPLESKLPPAPAPQKHEKPAPGFYHPLVVQARFNPDNVMQILGIESRNTFFFWLGNRLAESGVDKATKESIIEEIYNNLKNNSGFSLREAKNAGRV